MKILYVDPAVQSATSSKYRYYDGIYDQLIRKHDVFLLRQPFNDLNGVIHQTGFRPDILIFGVGFFGKTHFFGKINNLNIPTACFLYKPQNDLDKKLDFCKINDIDLIYTPIPTYQEYEDITGVKTILFPFGFDPNFFKPRNIEKTFDFGFSGALHNSALYPKDSFQVQNLRPKIGEILRNSSDLNIFWKSSDDASKAFIDSYDEYATTINRAKMWLATLAAFGDVTPRHYEVLGSGTALFCQEIPEPYKFLLKDGVNCVEFKNDLSDFKDKILHYKNNPDELDKITDNAVDFFHNNWTWEHRAADLIKEIEQVS
mgnify:CR=1 FL=1